MLEAIAGAQQGIGSGSTPTCGQGTAFRKVAASLHRVEPEMILAGNGSDDLLTIVTRAFVGPGDLVAYPTPSYILYRTPRRDPGCEVRSRCRSRPTLDARIPTGFPSLKPRLAFIANPNSPSGTALDLGSARGDRRSSSTVLLVVDDGEHMSTSPITTPSALIEGHPNVADAFLRTLSKGKCTAWPACGSAT